MGVRAQVEVRPNGIFRLNVTGHDTVLGEYPEVENSHRVVFSWRREGRSVEPGSTGVEVEMIPEGDGTRVVLRHSGLPTDQRGLHHEGWEHYLARLVTLTEGSDPGQNPWATGSRDWREEGPRGSPGRGCRQEPERRDHIPNPVMHWEIATKNPNGLSQFYTDVFGWKVDSENPMNYDLVETGESEGAYSRPRRAVPSPSSPSTSRWTTCTGTLTRWRARVERR